eukprot:11836051-Alexandrium_andersonii.AAC.1
MPSSSPEPSTGHFCGTFRDHPESVDELGIRAFSDGSSPRGLRSQPAQPAKRRSPRLRIGE